MTITFYIVVACVLVSLSALNNRDIFYKLDFQPFMIDRNKQWYRFVSHAFIHADWGHLAVNMYVLYQFGKMVEFQFAMYFPDRWVLYYILLYLGGILFSSLPGYVRHRNDYTYHGVGASGAVSAIVYAFILMEPMAPLGILFIPFHLPAWIFGLLYLALEYYLDRNAKSQIAHSAHYFGAIYGLVLTFLLNPQFLLRFF